MRHRNRPAPGTIRITPVNASPPNVGLPPQFGQTVSNGSSPLKWTLLLLALLGFLFIWGYEGQNQPQTDSNPVTSATPGPAAQVSFDDASTPIDVRGAKCAVLIWRDYSSTGSTSATTSDTTSDTTLDSNSATVFTYDRLDIREVNSINEIPAHVLSMALLPNSFPSYPQTNAATTDSASVSASGVARRIGREVPFIFYGDVDIETGDLINTDLLYTKLVAQHGELKAASLTLVDGSPRGPPTETLGPIRTVYIVGKIRTFVGPYRFDKSVHNARIIDLDNVNSDSHDPHGDGKREKDPNENLSLHPEPYHPEPYHPKPYHPKPYHPEPYHPEPYHPEPRPKPHPHRPAVRPGIL